MAAFLVAYCVFSSFSSSHLQPGSAPCLLHPFVVLGYFSLHFPPVIWFCFWNISSSLRWFAFRSHACSISFGIQGDFSLCLGSFFPPFLYSLVLRGALLMLICISVYVVSVLWHTDSSTGLEPSVFGFRFGSSWDF